MISELKRVGQSLTDEQQIYVVIHSLCISSEYMKVQMTHSDSLSTFKHIRMHIVIEETHIKVVEQ